MELNPTHQEVADTARERVKAYMNRLTVAEVVFIPGEPSDEVTEGKN